jgi:hypothetical protein
VLIKLEGIKQSIGDVKKEQALLSLKVTMLMRANGEDGSLKELPGEIQFPIKSIRELSILEKRLEDVQLKFLLVSNIGLLRRILST